MEREKSNKLGWYVWSAIAAGAMGYLWQRHRTQQDRQALPPLGKLYEVNGSTWHLNCMGEGEPTILVDCGLASFSVDWQLIQPEVAKHTRICTYDRAGTGWSDPVPGPRTSLLMMSQLRALLDAANIRGPFIVAGQSLGGLNLRLFTHLYPAEVLGAVLIEGAHEDIYARLGPNFRSLLDSTALLRYPATAAAHLGVARLVINTVLAVPAMHRFVNQHFSDNMLGHFSAEQLERLVVPRCWSNYLPTVIREFAGFAASTSQVKVARAIQPQVFGDKKLVVVKANVDKAARRFRRVSYFSVEAFKRTWTDMQHDLLNLSSNSELRVADQSGHSIMLEQPDIIATAILDVLAAVRQRV